MFLILLPGFVDGPQFPACQFCFRVRPEPTPAHLAIGRRAYREPAVVAAAAGGRGRGLTRLSLSVDLPVSGRQHRTQNLLGLPVRIGIVGADGVETVRCGVVSQAQLLGADGGFAQYGLTIESPFSLLRFRRTSRVF